MQSKDFIISLMSVEIKLFLVTAPKANAAELARELVNLKVAACVNIIPEVRSIYRWEGAICEELEQLLIIKVDRGKAALLKTEIKRLHPYDTPEIIELSPTDVEEKYANWVKQSCA